VRVRRSGLIAAALVLCVGTEGGAINLAPSDRDLARALQIGSGDERTRQRFHAQYIIPGNNATVEQLEVVTPFRRVVSITEEHSRLGDWIFSHGGIAPAKAALEAWRNKLSIVARLRFHPQNTLIGIPDCEIRVGPLAPGGAAVLPLDTIRTPITAIASGRRGDQFTPLLGATIEAIFDPRSVGQTTRPVSVVMEGLELVRVPVDFTRLE
jgi:hypothetical protein